MLYSMPRQIDQRVSGNTFQESRHLKKLDANADYLQRVIGLVSTYTTQDRIASLTQIFMNVRRPSGLAAKVTAPVLEDIISREKASLPEKASEQIQFFANYRQTGSIVVQIG